MMKDHLPRPGGNVVSLGAKTRGKDNPGDVERHGFDGKALAGGQDDPRMQEAVRLMEAFLAIDEPASREAIVTLAEQLVSHDWARRGQHR